MATMDCLRTSIGAELQLREDVHDVHYLHNETLFAAAQEKYTLATTHPSSPFIYNPLFSFAGTFMIIKEWRFTACETTNEPTDSDSSPTTTSSPLWVTLDG